MQRFLHRTGAILALAALPVFALGPSAQAEPAKDASASAFGATIAGGGQEIVPPTPEVSAAMGDDSSDTLVDIPADPLAVSGTLTASAAAHPDADIDSAAHGEPAGRHRSLQRPGSRHRGEPRRARRCRRRGHVGGQRHRRACRGRRYVRRRAAGVLGQLRDRRSPGRRPRGPVERAGRAAPRRRQRRPHPERPQPGGRHPAQRRRPRTPTEAPPCDALVVTLLAAAGDPVAQVRIAHGEVGPLACGPAEQVVTATTQAPAPPTSQVAVDTALPRTGTDDGPLAAGGIALGLGALALFAVRRRLTA